MKIVKELYPLAIFFILVLIGLYVQDSIKKARLDKLGTTYSIATITNRNSRNESYYLEYIQKGKKISFTSTGIGKWLTLEKRVRIGERVYIVFPKGNPEKAEFYLDFDVPDNLPAPSPNGWTLEELQKLDPDFKPEGITDWW